jgi:hypothetical protein
MGPTEQSDHRDLREFPVHKEFKEIRQLMIRPCQPTITLGISVSPGEIQLPLM